jgi:hypothetical protein
MIAVSYSIRGFQVTFKVSSDRLQEVFGFVCRMSPRVAETPMSLAIHLSGIGEIKDSPRVIPP